MLVCSCGRAVGGRVGEGWEGRAGGLGVCVRAGEGWGGLGQGLGRGVKNGTWIKKPRREPAEG